MKRPCKACGSPLIIAKDEAGQTIPLDAQAAVYELKDSTEQPIAIRVTGEVFASHLACCVSPEVRKAGGR